jgi:uncharacterized protein YdaU (DUF1376 family)
MSARPYYKHFPSDFIAGTSTLTAEEKGVYIVLLDLIYMRGGPIDNDASKLAKVCGCGPRRWRAIRDRLIAAGKLQLADGCLTNGRAEQELTKAGIEHGILSSAGSAGGQKRTKNARKTREKRAKNASLKSPESAKINDLLPFEPQAVHSPESIVQKEESTPKKKDDSTSPKRIAECSVSSMPSLVDRALAVWNETVANKLPKARGMTDARQTRMRKLIADLGGIEGWRGFCQEIADSIFLTSGKFPCCLDWCIKPENALKIREGNYRNRTNPEVQANVYPGTNIQRIHGSL